MNREEKRKGEEGDDDQIDKTNGHTWRRGRGRERSQIDRQEGDGGIHGSRSGRQHVRGDGCIARDSPGPHGTELGHELLLQLVELGQDVLVDGVLVPCREEDGLDGARRVVGGVAGGERRLEQGRGVVVDDNGGPEMEVVDGLANLHGIVAILRSRYHLVAQGWLCRVVDQTLNQLRQRRAHEGVDVVVWCRPAVKVDNGYFQVFHVLFRLEEDGPVQGQYCHDEYHKNQHCCVWQEYTC